MSNSRCNSFRQYNKDESSVWKANTSKVIKSWALNLLSELGDIFKSYFVYFSRLYLIHYVSPSSTGNHRLFSNIIQSTITAINIGIRTSHPIVFFFCCCYRIFAFSDTCVAKCVQKLWIALPKLNSHKILNCVVVTKELRLLCQLRQCCSWHKIKNAKVCKSFYGNPEA